MNVSARNAAVASDASPYRELLRRDFLCAGAGGGLSLLGLINARSAGATIAPASTSAIRACIFVFYYGGPSHLDTYDPKPDAPSEVRGEFGAIATSVPGLRICEHLPRMARVMHKCALVRSVHHDARLHDSASIHALTGRPLEGPDRELLERQPQTYPSFGSAVSYLRRDASRPVPHAALPFVFRNVHEVPCQGGGFLGAAFDPLQISVDAEARSYSIGALSRDAALGDERFQRRRSILETMNLGTSLDPAAVARVKDVYQRAWQLFASREVQAALDLTRESPETRERYGFGPPPATIGEGGGGGNGAELGVARQMRGQNLLVARRLVEAGVPFVNVYDFRQQGQNWDAHFKGFNQHKTFLLPLADQSLAALIEDLDERGLLDSTLVVAMGEFGRTPRINKEGGRDHWPDCFTALLAGGGVQGGAIYGASDRFGAYPAESPVTPGDLAATIYARFGLDPRAEIHDALGRPHRLATGEPILALF